MCGLACIVRCDGEAIPDEWIARLDAALAHRGPDDSGSLRLTLTGPTQTAHVALVHRRLSILDHEGGSQPMSTADGHLSVIFNGCIYNHRELRRQLEAHGARFASAHSDTEVLLHGWRAWGEALPTKLEGMFAFVILDQADRLLFAARDRAGEKPLYVLRRPTMLVFASERSAFRACLGGVGTATADPEALASYLLWGYVDDQAWLDGSLSLRPGEMVTVDLTAASLPLRTQSYWSPPSRREEVDRAGAANFEEHVDALLAGAVAQRLEADAPLGCFLSGGVDSSLVAALAQRHKPDLRTFCVRMNDPRYDESRYAQDVADHLHLAHTTLEVAPQPSLDLPRLIILMGEPFADSSLLPTHWVSRAVREHMKVALAGDGGDELFLGYERHIAGRLLSRFGGVLRLIPAWLLRAGHPKSRLTKLTRLARAARRRGWQAQYQSIVCLFTTAQLEALGLPAPPLDLDLPPAPTAGDGFAAADFMRNLPWDLLRKVDAASMACGLEVRAPFLDTALMEYVLTLPLATLTPRMERKAFLRRVAQRYIPKDLLQRPKMGFSIPLGEWFREDFGGMRTLLHDTLTAGDPFPGLPLDLSGVRRLLAEHDAGKANHEHRLFALLTLALWAREQ